MVRKKSLLIGINYTGSQNQLQGCHHDVENAAEYLSYRGYSNDPRCQAPIDWLVSEPGTCNFLHHSGHGSQVRDPTRNHPSGVLDTIYPVDFRTRGQIDSDTLHIHLSCHFVYRSDDDGNVNLVDNVKDGFHLLGEAKLQQADLYAGAASFFRSFKTDVITSLFSYMKRIPYPTYLQALQDTRNTLRQSDYTQVPQLSVGLQMDLNQGLVLRVHHHRQNSNSSKIS
ncbi:metacaspase [Lipomyces tetrasporus]|uniref:Metacaspase n=1 Tax=Lipomyces tetrasporus TaxID=54092 RepID=A0AAD7QSP2_9ASCO|nr:metacaspase [Lipomyces tetrasporus]KAJ8100812.1 metacaspase [Lipomyces tetrasporus]